jgi:hypothetical protein
MTQLAQNIQGSIVAIVTPMFEDGSVDWKSLEKLVEWHIQQGTHSIVAVGTTGEASTLSMEEHTQVIKEVIRVANKRIPIIAGTGANSTREAIELTKAAKELGADAAWKLAPALAAGNCIVLKPAEQTPLGISVLMELIGDLLPAGVLNIVNGMGREAGMPLASSKRIAKIAFTGSTATGRVIAQAAASNLIPATLELGGKSPNIFFADVMDKDDGFLDKAIEGLVLFAFNQGEVCTCPSRALIQESIYEPLMAEVMKKIKKIKRATGRCRLRPG